MMNKKSQTSNVRVKRPERRQIMWRDTSLDQMLSDDHPVRCVWAYVDSLDLSPLYAKIKAVEGGVGRDAVDPKILLALWMYATIEGISSARHLARLCDRDAPYMWICGGVGVNHHLLSDFRTGNPNFMDDLLTDTIATLMSQGLVTLNVVAQDGMRVRASAGTSSFRRQQTLEKHRDAAREQVERLREESENDIGHSDTRTESARKRAADERLKRVERALEELVELQQKKEKRKKGTGKEARCSTTDPEARNMKMGDTGFRPAYNVQFGSEGSGRMIVSVGVTNSGSDGGQMGPIHQDILQRYGKVPDTYLIDCGFATKADITAAEKAGSAVHAPVYDEKRMKERGRDPYERKPGDSDEMFAFRQRMATDPAKELYKQRAPLAEFPNAVCRNHGLRQFRVRGQEKARSVALLHAVVFNFQRMKNLGWLPGQLATP